MEWARIGGVAAVGLTALLILRAYKPEWAPMLRMAVTVIAVGLTLSMAVTALSYAQELAVGLGTPDGEGWSILLKALGVAFLTEVSASVCRDSGESGLAMWVETAGKLEILLLSFPLIRAVMDTVATLVSGG
jgi:stage III sporulation protein AD